MYRKKIITIDQISNYIGKYIKLDYLGGGVYAETFIEACKKFIFKLTKIEEIDVCKILTLEHSKCNNYISCWSHDFYYNKKSDFLYSDPSDRMIII